MVHRFQTWFGDAYTLSAVKDEYQFVTQWLDAGDIGDLLGPHHSVHVLHLTSQAGHRHWVEVGVPDP